jgi:peptidoglycan/LPS O-acetylase OafA/YrhL
MDGQVRAVTLRSPLTAQPSSRLAAAERAPARPRATLRPEIQALRALAVALVLVYHLWPAVVPGGFVGVDVFFAISGFLITSLLLREAERTGSVSLRAFWARRARRILPAALLTVLVCALATVALVPLTRWGQFFTEMRASTAYVQNWQLAGDAVDYLAAANAPSPVQHYWSLSIEEQFYLVWPVLIAAALRVSPGSSAPAPCSPSPRRSIGRRRPRGPPSRGSGSRPSPWRRSPTATRRPSLATPPCCRCSVRSR